VQNLSPSTRVHSLFHLYRLCIFLTCCFYFLLIYLGIVILSFPDTFGLLIDAWPSLSLLSQYLPATSFTSFSWLFYSLPFALLFSCFFPVSIFIRTIIAIITKLPAIHPLAAVSSSALYGFLSTLYYLIGSALFSAVFLPSFPLFFSDPYLYRAYVNDVTDQIPFLSFFIYILGPCLCTSYIFSSSPPANSLSSLLLSKWFLSRISLLLVASFVLLLIGQKSHLTLFLLSLLFAFVLQRTTSLSFARGSLSALRPILLLFQFPILLSVLSIVFIFVALNGVYYSNDYASPLFNLAHPIFRMSAHSLVYYPDPPDVSMPFASGLGLIGIGGLPIDDNINAGCLIYDNCAAFITAPAFMSAFAMGRWSGALLSFIIFLLLVFLVLFVFRCSLSDPGLYALLFYLSYYFSNSSIYLLLNGSYSIIYPLIIYSLLRFPRAGKPRSRKSP
jgi:hypothetical protein